MNELFKNIPITIPVPHPDNYKNKRQFFFTDIGRKYYINILRDKTPPINMPILIQEAHANMISRLGYKNRMIIGMTGKLKFIGISQNELIKRGKIGR